MHSFNLFTEEPSTIHRLLSLLDEEIYSLHFMGLLAEHGPIRPHTLTVGRAAFVCGIRMRHLCHLWGTASDRL